MTRLMLLYPKSYRRAVGEEIADVHARSINGAATPAVLRATAALAAYALRVRLKLTSAHQGGRALAAAAPLVLAAAAAPALVQVMNAGAWLPAIGGPVNLLTPSMVAVGATLLTSVFVATGLWRAARLMVLASLAVELRSAGVRCASFGDCQMGRFWFSMYCLTTVSGAPPQLPAK
ncbi:hypothetical protein ACFQ78_28245 [Streptomyces sp. NPDC056519]|uniref:hypothetical protein n=1 Tax=Streptomyces sp. NPDC056519 TaxID=3345849 RepID=UPI00367A5120